MNCLVCGLDNPATVTFCKKCGAKLDLTAEEIQAALVEKEKIEKKKMTEHYVHNTLLFSIALFLLALTCFFMTGGIPEKTYNVPSAAWDGAVDRSGSAFQIQPDFDPLRFMQPVQYPLSLEK